MTTHSWLTGLKPTQADGQNFRVEALDATLVLDSIATSKTVYRTYVGGELKNELCDLTEYLKGLGGQLLYASVAPNGTIWKMIFIFESGYADVFSPHDGNKWCETTSVVTDRILSDNIRNYCNTNMRPKRSAGYIYTLVQSSSGVSIAQVAKAEAKVLTHNYEKQVIDQFLHVVSDLKSKNPSGRISIFSGAPGTGKTYLVRGLLSLVEDAMFIIIPPTLIPSLSGPSMIQTILQHRSDSQRGPTVFIIEDADDVLVTRGPDNMAAVSALLNLSDGLLGCTLDIRIVATTNALHKDLDPAIERPGRLSEHITVDALSYERAREALEKISGGKMTKLPQNRKYTVAELYQLARPERGATIKPKAVDRKVGFSMPEPKSLDERIEAACGSGSLASDGTMLNPDGSIRELTDREIAELREQGIEIMDMPDEMTPSPVSEAPLE